jgi:hypothetical protein
MKHPEYNLQVAVCNYLKLQYPNVLFLSTGISLGLTPPQQGRNKAIQCKNFHCPDVIIFEQRGGYNGLFIELKIGEVLTKSGKYKTPHIEAQADTMQKLRDKGYCADFGIGFDKTKSLIDWYLQDNAKTY